MSVESILTARQGRVQTRRLASGTGTVLSIHMSWGPVTQLYTRHLYALINSVGLLNCRVILTEEVVNELTFWLKLPRLRFEDNIWPPTEGDAIRMASDAIDMGWGGHTMQGVPENAHGYFSEAESTE